METDIRIQFQEMFGKNPLVAASPGRVNLIGEHTDYNEGFVLPAAVDKIMMAAMAPNESKTLEVYANQYRQRYSFALDQIRPVEGWPTYLLGMIYFLKEKNLPIGGIDVIIDGNVPLGAGMSSSAALCSCFGFALNELFTLGQTRMDLALTGQKTEHQFAGVKCGIMDQFASLHGKAGHVIKLDCRSLQYEYIPFDFPDYRIVLVNTMVSHALAETQYNIRRQQCEEAVGVMQKINPAIRSLRDVSMEQLLQAKEKLDEVVFRRSHFIVSENLRLLAGCKLLAEGNLGGFGRLMYETHKGLSQEYEVSCPQSDYLVDLARTIPGVLGSRQMGGGFGGCTINIVRQDVVLDFQSIIGTGYQQFCGKTPEIYVTRIEDGARLLGNNGY